MAVEGKNKVAQSLVDLQPTAVLQLFRIFPDKINQPTLFLGFHGGSEFDKSITWQGVQYLPLAIESEGFDILGDGKLARPKIRIANRNNIVTNFLQNYKDLINAKVIRKKVQVKFLDDDNFEGGNPFGAADPKAELANETWVMGRKTQESKIFVEFELNSPLDLENFSVNSRNVVAKFCPWQYRGEGCRYEGFPIERDDGTPFVDADGKSVVPRYSGPPPVSFIESNYAEWNGSKNYEKGEIVWVASPTIQVPELPQNFAENSTARPLKTVYVAVRGEAGDINSGQNPFNNPSYWQKDGCTKKLSACQKRFNAVSDLSYVGGSATNNSFPAIKITGKIRDGLTRPATNTGFFHSHAPQLTGTLTGDFTLMGWANVTDKSPRGSALWTSSLKADAGVWPVSRYLSFPLTFSMPSSLPNSIDTPGSTSKFVGASWMGWEINKTTYSSRHNAYMSTLLGPTQVTNSSNVEEWNCYIATKGSGIPEINGVGGEGISQLDFYINGVKKDVNDANDNLAGYRMIHNSSWWGVQRDPQWANRAFGNFGSWAQRTGVTWNATEDPDQLGPIPVTFMIGGQQFYWRDNDSADYRHSQNTVNCINGHIGTWALWRRVLTEKEIEYLVRQPPIPDEYQNTVTFVAREYDQCTGEFGTLTGSGRLGEDGTVLIPEHSLVAWWDATTGFIGDPADDVTGMLDIHTGDFHLTGSGSFTGVEKSYWEGDVTVVQNPTPRHPRFGGFPGTDGFSYGRNTSL